jgi:hypothetical protein
VKVAAVHLRCDARPLGKTKAANNTSMAAVQLIAILLGTRVQFARLGRSRQTVSRSPRGEPAGAPNSPVTMPENRERAGWLDGNVVS